MARCFYHPLGEQTSYTYDLAGRVLTEDHSDRGLTTTTYDNASNVMEINTPATQSFGGSITMDYDFNRLVSRLMPNSSGMDLYDIQYTYGYKGDGRNGAGRVVKVEQGQTFKIDDLRYDELGQSAEEVVSIDVPMQGVRMFTTRKFYDSFGRILQAGYPDGDKVDYQYNALGELSGINSTLGGVTQPIITAISYNGYGQISLLTYGNGTSTTYSYASGNTKKATTLMSSAVTGKEQGSTSPTTLLSRQYAYNKQGMVSTMDRSIAGSLLSQSSLVNYHDSYSYDAFGRLEGHQQLNGTTPQYDLTMSYNKAGGITFKDGNGNGFMNAQSLNYNLEYGYSPAKPHQLEHIWDADNAITTQFQYNTSGSITQIDDPSQGIPQEFYWNEAQQLTGVKNQQGVHHYIYDHQGERIMKSSLITSTVYLNDQVIDDVNNLDPYTVYVNPFYVVTGFMGGDRVSKHYYMNQQRVATDISINYDPNGNGGAEAQGASPRANAQNLALVDLLKVLRALEQPELDTTALTLPRMESVYPELQPSSTTSTALTENITNRILFWYHPDYLGNVDLVTEKDGYAYEFFVYTPWGEEMHQWNANTFNFSSPYRFNGKELDPETGLAYYGARYYQNKIGVWLSVDPKYMQTLMKYEFSANNPIKFIDADGAKPILPDFQVEPEDPINWELVRMGTWNCFSGGVVIVFSGATIIASDGASIEFGALSGFTFGIGSFGFGLAQVTAGFEGSSEEIPSGIFEGVDIATGGDGSLGQIVDIASKGYPKSLPEKAITAVDIANSTLLNLENSEPTNTAKAPSLPIGSIPFPPQDATIFNLPIVKLDDN
jgi:RHS repeat-associated protein